MKSRRQAPIILANPHAEGQQLEGDCACPAPSVQYASKPGLYEAAWQTAPGLYRAGLPGGYELAFNTLGTESVSVLNEPARAILDSFRAPRYFAQAQVLAEFEAGQFSPAVQKMIDAGLLVSGAPEQVGAQSVSDTLTAWLHVTNQCNLACDYCYVHKNLERMDSAIGRQAIEAIFRSAQANNYQRLKIKYSGGEATLNFPLLIELQQYALRLTKQAGMALDGVVLTNGVALSERMIENLRENSLRISISLDGIGAAHDSQRKFQNGQGSFAQVEHSLDRLAKANIVPSISITLTARSTTSLPETVRYLLARNLPFSINFYRENECPDSPADLQYDQDSLIRACRETFQILEQNLPPFSLLGSLLDRTRLDVAHERPCGVGDSYLVIDQRGGVAKCHMQIERTLTDVSAPDALAVIRADRSGLMNPPVADKPDCADCQWRSWCAGGCPALTQHISGSCAHRSPNCAIYKALFPEILRLEGLRLLKYGLVEKSVQAIC